MIVSLFNIVLLHPQIPNNTGNIGRTAAATGCALHIVHPIAFSMDEKARRRAGLDYWDKVDCREHESWEAFLENESPERLWLFTKYGSGPPWGADLSEGDYLLFGGESDGVPPEVRAWAVERWGEQSLLAFPMESGIRSLNLATAVCAAVYEGMRQVRSRP